MDTRAAARGWVDGWTRGWESADPEPIAALYAKDAVFRSHPFREPEAGAREYALRSFADDTLVECRFGDPIVDGGRAAVEYWAVLRTPGGEQTLAGIAVIRFEPDGLVVEERDYWSMEPDRTPAHF